HTRFSRDWSSDVCSSDLFLQSLQFTTLGKRIFTECIRAVMCVILRQRINRSKSPDRGIVHAISVLIPAETKIILVLLPLKQYARSEERRGGTEGRCRIYL